MGSVGDPIWLERRAMSARRTLILIVALAVGTVAAVSSVLYLNSVQSRANGNAKLVRVYKVASAIPKGTTGDVAIGRNLIVASSIPQKFFPQTAVTDLVEIKGKVAPLDLAPGQILVDNQFVAPSVAHTSFSTTNVPSGQVAITISVDQVRGVAGLIVPGDKVDLMGFFTPTASTDPNQQYAHFFYQNVNVIAIGSVAAPTAGNTAPATNPGGGLFTLAVPPDAAERIVQASQKGSIYLALVPPDNAPTAIPPVQAGTIDSPSGLTPYPAA
jgi:pilus assembly protein CpaB